VVSKRMKKRRGRKEREMVCVPFLTSSLNSRDGNKIVFNAVCDETELIIVAAKRSS
jgi:hypothetical protein